MDRELPEQLRLDIDRIVSPSQYTHHAFDVFKFEQNQSLHEGILLVNTNLAIGSSSC